jgi:hypothetical protein
MKQKNDFVPGGSAAIKPGCVALFYVLIAIEHLTPNPSPAKLERGTDSDNLCVLTIVSFFFSFQERFVGRTQ